MKANANNAAKVPGAGKKIDTKKTRGCNAKATDVVTVNQCDFWHGAFPRPGAGHLRSKAALMAIAYPLAEMAVVKKVGNRVHVTFPHTIALPKTFTVDEAKDGILILGVC